MDCIMGILYSPLQSSEQFYFSQCKHNDYWDAGDIIILVRTKKNFSELRLCNSIVCVRKIYSGVCVSYAYHDINDAFYMV